MNNWVSRLINRRMNSSNALRNEKLIADAFDVANDSFTSANLLILPYTIRADNRNAILSARARFEQIPAFSDPADSEPYTDAYLDAHTAAMDSLTASVYALTDAFTAYINILGPGKLCAAAATVYKTECTCYEIAVDAYSKAASCALLNAAQGKLTAVKNEYEVMLLEARASNRITNAVEAVSLKATAFAMKAKTAQDKIKCTQLGEKAKIAESKAIELRDIYKDCLSIAVKALEASQ